MDSHSYDELMNTKIGRYLLSIIVVNNDNKQPPWTNNIINQSSATSHARLSIIELSDCQLSHSYGFAQSHSYDELEGYDEQMKIMKSESTRKEILLQVYEKK